MTLSRSLAKWAASKSSRPKSNPEEASREFDNVRASIGWHEGRDGHGAQARGPRMLHTETRVERAPKKPAASALPVGARGTA
ncbi:hypothetical protein ACCO45_005019 [Purpureocillium lilacinum]|uniref:Uncharacterized protein n=1 Tax=Purpureocillium lilacinum TaxID=33203 RepID=A0ACC4DU80_PURLI